MAARARVDDVLRDFRIARSTYFSQAAMAAVPTGTRTCGARARGLRGPEGRYGSLSVWALSCGGRGRACARPRPRARGHGDPVVVSERRSCAGSCARRGQSHSGQGAPAPAPPTRARPTSAPRTCRFERTGRTASAPTRRAGSSTDVTEFDLGGLKVYLSPIIDCFDGCPVAWRTSTRPDDELTAGSLEDALGRLEEGCAVHRRRRQLLLRQMEGRLRGQRPRQVDVAQGQEPRQREGGGLLRDAQAGVLLREGSKDDEGVSTDEYIVWYRSRRSRDRSGRKTICSLKLCSKTPGRVSSSLGNAAFGLGSAVSGRVRRAKTSFLLHIALKRRANPPDGTKRRPGAARSEPRSSRRAGVEKNHAGRERGGLATPRFAIIDGLCSHRCHLRFSSDTRGADA